MLRCQYPEPVTRGDPPHCRESRRIYGIRNKLALYEAAIKHEIWAETSLWEKRATLLISGQLNNKEIGMIWDFLPPRGDAHREKRACGSFLLRPTHFFSQTRPSSFFSTFNLSGAC